MHVCTQSHLDLCYCIEAYLFIKQDMNCESNSPWKYPTPISSFLLRTYFLFIVLHVVKSMETSSFLHHAVPIRKNDYLSRCLSCTAVKFEEKAGILIIWGIFVAGLCFFFFFFFWVGQDETIFTKVHSGWKNNETSKGKSVIKYNLDILILRIPLHLLIWFHHAPKLSWTKLRVRET